MVGIKNNKTYATFGVGRSLTQVRQAFVDRRNAEKNMSALFLLLLKAEERISARLGRPVENLRILEIGPGQGLERARYFGIMNEVIGFDQDVIPVHTRMRDYYQLLRQNGFGRLAKTLGRKLIVGKSNEHAWAKAVGARPMKVPQMVQGDICGRLPELGQFDLVVSWSVFEHLTDPRKALENIIQLLKPGGVFYLSIHLYTAINGHHDIRSFTGFEDQVPLWGHLRETTRGLIHPSAYLNQWRLGQWRELFGEKASRYSEYLESYDHHQRYGSRLTSEIRTEICKYTDEELFTVDAIYVWQKPGQTEGNLHVS